MSRVVAIMACGVTLAACSTSMPSLNFLSSAPPTEALRIESEPPGAEAKTSLGQSCRTPCELAIQPGSEFSVTLALNGYQPQTVSVRPEMSPQAAALRLAPNPVYAELQPATAAPPRKPVKKKKPIATATRPAASSPVASAATPAPAPAAAVPTPSPSSEPAASATNYPWPSR
jgi:PEGA domain